MEFFFHLAWTEPGIARLRWNAVMSMAMVAVNFMLDESLGLGLCSMLLLVWEGVLLCLLEWL